MERERLTWTWTENQIDLHLENAYFAYNYKCWLSDLCGAIGVQMRTHRAIVQMMAIRFERVSHESNVEHSNWPSYSLTLDKWIRTISSNFKFERWLFRSKNVKN